MLGVGENKRKEEGREKNEGSREEGRKEGKKKLSCQAMA